MLRSASGRAYLAFCPDREREAVLRRLRENGQPGDERAHDAKWILAVVRQTRERGYSVRDPEFGGHYAKTREQWDDVRNSIAMPIRVDGHVLGCINLTWKNKLMTLAAAVKRHLGALSEAVKTIEGRAGAEGVGVASAASSPGPASSKRPRSAS
jgi:IclR family mhp operon transcriptional activator